MTFDTTARSMGLLHRVGLAGIMALCLISSGLAQEVSPDVKKLLQERLSTLTEIHQLLDEGYKRGEIGIEQVLESRFAILRSKLDLCSTREERIEIHQEIVKVAVENVRIAAEKASRAEAGRIDTLKAKARLIDCQLELKKAEESR